MSTLDPTGESEPVVPCEKCPALLCSVADRALRAAHPGEVLEKPVLRAPLAEKVMWPDGCVVCGSPATRTLIARGESSKAVSNLLTSAVGLGLAGTVGVGFGADRGKTVVTLDAPHCQDHEGGVAVDFSLGGSPRIVYRAVDRFRAFCEKNGVQAPCAPTDGDRASCRACLPHFKMPAHAEAARPLPVRRDRHSALPRRVHGSEDQKATGACRDVRNWRGSSLQQNCALCCRVELNKQDVDEGTGNVSPDKVCTCSVSK